MAMVEYLDEVRKAGSSADAILDTADGIPVGLGQPVCMANWTVN